MNLRRGGYGCLEQRWNISTLQSKSLFHDSLPQLRTTSSLGHFDTMGYALFEDLYFLQRPLALERR